MKFKYVVEDWLCQSRFDRWVTALLLLYPLLGHAVHHWYSVFFTLLCFSSLVVVRRQWKDLDRLQLLSASGAVLFFIVFLISATSLGWQKLEFRALEDEIRIAFLFPLVCLFLCVPKALSFFLRGVLLSVFIFFIQVVYAVLVHKTGIEATIYSYLFFSGNVVVFGSIATYHLLAASRLVGATLYTVISCLTIVLTGSRSAILAVIFILCLAVLSFPRGVYKKLALLIGLIVFAIVSYYTPYVKDRVDRDVNSVIGYLSAENPIAYTKDDSWSQRLIMWHASSMIVKDNPVIGVGRFHYNEHAKSLVNENKVHHAAALFSHPHSIYFEVLVSKGWLGIVPFIMIFLPMLILGWRNRFRAEGGMLMALVISILFLGLFEAAPLVKGGYISIWVIPAALLLSSLQRNSNREETLQAHEKH